MLARSESGDAGHSAGRVRQAQSVIVRTLERLLADLAGAQRIEAKLGLEDEKADGTLEEKPMKMAEKLEAALTKFADEQRKAIEQANNLPIKEVHDLTAEEKESFRALAAVEDDLAKFLEELVSDLSELPEQDFSQPSLREEVIEVMAEVELAEDALKLKNKLMAIAAEQVALELAEELMHDLPKWLSDVPDKLKWDLEKPTEDYDVPMAELLSDEYTGLRRALIDMARASTEQRPGDPLNMRALLRAGDAGANGVRTPISDTTTCVAADRWGNVVACTPSCNLVGNQPDPRTGVTQGNRLRCLNTTPGHPNRIEPGKRPRLTLTPTLVTRDDGAVIAISVAGGDMQDQTTLNALLNHLEFGMAPAQAVTAPRFHTQHLENSFDSDPDRARAFVAPAGLNVNSAVAQNVQAELIRRGHRLTTTPDAIGMPVMLTIDEAGAMHAAGDPRAGRHAGALE